MYIDPQEVESWKSDMKSYEVSRKQRGYESPQIHVITFKEVKASEQIFNPILQVYNKQEQDDQEKKQKLDKINQDSTKHSKATEKYQQEYDIINLEKKPDVVKANGKEYQKNVILPNFREYNIITNGTVDKQNFENVKFLVKPKVYEKQIDSSQFRDFNIISNKYYLDDENKFINEQETSQKEVFEKYQKTHDYNILTGSMYDEQREKNFQEERKVKQANFAKVAIEKLPPTMRFRETVIVDPSKPVPEEIKLIDEKQQNAKKRYQLRYIVENQYHERDIENQERQQQRLQNKLQKPETPKDIDIITLLPPEPNHQSKKEKPLTTWEQVQRTKLASDDANGHDEGDYHYPNDQHEEYTQQEKEKIRYFNEGQEEDSRQIEVPTTQSNFSDIPAHALERKGSSGPVHSGFYNSDLNLRKSPPPALQGTSSELLASGQPPLKSNTSNRLGVTSGASSTIRETIRLPQIQRGDGGFSHSSVEGKRKDQINYNMDQPLHIPVVQFVPGNRKIKTGGFVSANSSVIHP